jgi:hypothetical protein
MAIQKIHSASDRQCEVGTLVSSHLSRFDDRDPAPGETSK